MNLDKQTNRKTNMGAHSEVTLPMNIIGKNSKITVEKELDVKLTDLLASLMTRTAAMTVTAATRPTHGQIRYILDKNIR